MSHHHHISTWITRIIIASVLVFSAAGTALAAVNSTIFSYDGKGFIRTHATLLTKESKSAVNTKLDRASPAYSALVQKHSYSGKVTLFHLNCDANYAPLTDEKGNLTGALMVCVTE